MGKQAESIVSDPQSLDGIEGNPFAHKVGYARVSTGDQNPQLQIDALLRDGVATERIYHEQASGAAKNRPAFAKLIRDVRPGDVLVIWKLDRLGRSLVEVLKTLEILRERGVELRIITQNFDSRTAMGKAMLMIAVVFSELERDLTIERTKAGLAAAAARGRKGGRRLSYSEKQIEHAAERFRAGETLKEIRKSVKSRTGKLITLLRLSQRIAEFEKRKVEGNGRRSA